MKILGKKELPLYRRTRISFFTVGGRPEHAPSSEGIFFIVLSFILGG